MPLITKEGQEVVPLIIHSKPVPIDKERLCPVTSARTGETIHYFHSATSKDCEAACDAAWQAFSRGDAKEGPWKRVGVERRRNLLNRVADIFVEKKEELLKAQMEETSCDQVWATNNVDTTVRYLREIAACVSSIRGTIPPSDKPGTMAFIYKQPIGPVLVIPPWNAALVLCTRALASAIGAGCTVVLKASELSPYTHSLIHDIFIYAGVPPGVINLLISARSNASEITESLISNPHIRKVDFIGSAAVGRIIGATAAKYLKPVLMELGGKCPAIVLDDANLQRAAGMCARGALMHHGQICFSTERIIVQRAVADKFTEALVKAVETLGAQGVAGTAVSQHLAQHAYEVLEDAKSKGSKFIVGDAQWEDGDRKNTLKPAIVAVDPKARPDDLRIIDEETFGPSASLYVVDTDEEAIEIANRSAYGLNASVHTSDLERGLSVGRELEYGQVHLNFITVYTSPTGPQGGVKGSGWGRQNAIWGLNEFVEQRSITWHGK